MAITKTMKKKVIGLLIPVLLAGVLVGCGGQHQKSEATSSTVSSSSKPSESSSSVASQSSDSSSTATSSQSATVASSSSQASQQSSAADQSTSASWNSPTHKRKNRVSKTAVLNAVANQMSSQYKRQDLLMAATQFNGIYTVQVQENHQSKNMQNQGVDPSVNPTVAWFQTNTSGQLLRSDNGGASYYVVGRVK
ncbi:hypothetical protein GPK34_08280 [Secundilactobacillus kimchicus]|uniref:Lipoprotein n=1 Tax=Secundilactobacillus kimchicus JCM 15530 TaxID=1302272 RepID=A0A0R1HQQ8_9LACO|nr:hypothetical protein [Secundilactobacillus kimchicus]KRK48767.1 hypothetical protein FC96_GL001086 [Secundilactobacillus kimchicus JCM 15530]MBT9672024.1 hypothetical protein [Secundilactobacillus kimchicus]